MMPHIVCLPSCKNKTFLTLNPRIEIFFKNWAVSLFLLYYSLTSCKISEKSNEQSQRYLRTDGLTDGRADNGDYYGSDRVNAGSKM